jgi:hypothetical protein
MSDKIRRPRLDPAARRELAASIRFLANLHKDMTGNRPTAQALIEALRERGQDVQADELERLASYLRARRSKRSAK